MFFSSLSGNSLQDRSNELFSLALVQILCCNSTNFLLKDPKPVKDLGDKFPRIEKELGA